MAVTDEISLSSGHVGGSLNTLGKTDKKSDAELLKKTDELV